MSNITCKKCHHRHPAERTCAEALQLARTAAAARVEKSRDILFNELNAEHDRGAEMQSEIEELRMHVLAINDVRAEQRHQINELRTALDAAEAKIKAMEGQPAVKYYFKDRAGVQRFYDVDETIHCDAVPLYLAAGAKNG